MGKMLAPGITVILLLSLGLTACGSGSKPSATLAPANLTPLPTATAPQPAATTAPAKAAPRGSIVGALANLGDGWSDPHRQGTGGQRPLVLAMWDGLVNRDGQANIIPDIATSWQTSGDGLTWDFTLRKGVKYWNGQEVSAKDVKFSFERSIRPELKQYPGPEIAAAVASAEVVDDSHVRFHMKKVYAPFLDRLVMFMGIVPQEYTEKIGDVDFQSAPQGTGRWKHSSEKRGEFTSMEANTGYWDPERVPAVKAATFRLIPESTTRLAMLLTGEADIIAGLPGSDFSKVQALPGGKIIFSKGASAGRWAFADTYFPEASPFKDIRVRRAMNYAIDQQAIVDKIYFGSARPTGSFVMPTTLGYDPSIKPYPYDPALAKSLIAEAGYPAGFEFEMHATVAAKVVSEVLQAYYQAIGLRAKVQLYDAGTWAAKFRAREYRGLANTGFGAIAMYEPSALAVMFHSEGGQSFTREPEIDAIFAKLDGASDLAARAKLGGELSRALSDKVTSVMMPLVDAAFGVGPKIKSWDIGAGRDQMLRLETVRLAE